jgi:hypothetical protein
MAETIVPRLDSSQLIDLLKEMCASGHSDRESERMLLTFCLNCPDPLGAMNVVLDAPRGSTDEEIAREALALPARSMALVPTSELPDKHSLRTWRVAA